MGTFHWPPGKCNLMRPPRAAPRDYMPKMQHYLGIQETEIKRENQTQENILNQMRLKTEKQIRKVYRSRQGDNH